MTTTKVTEKGDRGRRRGQYLIKSHYIERTPGLPKREWFFRLIAGNGEDVGGGEGYTSRADCLRGIRAHRRTAITAAIVEDDTPPRRVERRSGD